MKKICVFGTTTTDMTLSIGRFPDVGETLKSDNLSQRPGGKGANQAVAAAKLGANVQFVSVIGYDTVGNNTLEKIRRNGVGIRYVGRVPKQTNVTILFEKIRDEHDEPSMILFSECTEHLTVELLERSYPAIDNAGILMLQLSTPQATVLAAAKRMKQNGGIVIVDPSPAQNVPEKLLKHIDIITPNEKELPLISGIENANESDETRQEAAQKLLDRGVKCVIHKAGAHGAYIFDAEGMRHIKPFMVKVVSTWGVGSVFNSGLAVGLARDMSLDEAVSFANAACAITIARGGSQSAVPDYDDCMDLLHGRLTL